LAGVAASLGCIAIPVPDGESVQGRMCSAKRTIGDRATRAAAVNDGGFRTVCRANHYGLAAIGIPRSSASQAFKTQVLVTATCVGAGQYKHGIAVSGDVDRGLDGSPRANGSALLAGCTPIPGIVAGYGYIVGSRDRIATVN
jgi:hypothetical protein